LISGFNLTGAFSADYNFVIHGLSKLNPVIFDVLPWNVTNFG